MYSWQEGSSAICYNALICLICMSNKGMNQFYGVKRMTVCIRMAGVSASYASTLHEVQSNWGALCRSKCEQKAAGWEGLKQSLDGGILINHWPTAGYWQAATALSAAAAHSCAHLPAQLLLMHICWIPHLFMLFLFQCPSSPLPPLLHLLHLFRCLHVIALQ